MYTSTAARKLKASQDEFCDKAKRGEWAGLGAFPQALHWEALVDVLGGHMKVCEGVIPRSLTSHAGMLVQTHRYETVELDDLVRVCFSPP